MPPTLLRSSLPLPARIIGSVFGLAFCGIGIALLVFLWFGQSDTGAPPLFFRIVGSLFAMVFTVTGATVGWNTAFGRPRVISPEEIVEAIQRPPTRAPSIDSYVCPHCAAPLGAKIEVSPLGDVKCPFCHSWFNIHKTQGS